MLFLSRNITRWPVPCWAQPPGYLIEQPAPLRKTRNTWLSGMSPVAAAFASPWSASALDPAEAGGAAAAEGAGGGGAGGGDAACLALPQPAASAAMRTVSSRILVQRSCPSAP